MKKVQMFGAEKIEINFDGVTAGIEITNNKTKQVALFEIDTYKTIRECTNDYKANPKAIARALAIYDDMREKVFA